MSAQRFRVDLLFGAIVRDADGKIVGRIHDVRADEIDGELRIVEYLLGSGAVLARFGIKLGKLIGLRKAPPEPLRVPWHRIDPTDPKCPRFLGKAQEL